MIGRTLSHVPTLASLNIRYKKTFGHKFRDAIATCGHYLKPIRKYIFPNFLAVHYFYIVSMTIITSILLYPVKNEKYIDILFLATGCTTQGGLNTVGINELTLYQQIIVYITCVLCTPIAIHGCLAFVRLYWFERYFDGIRDSSKRNFKMRRTRTILEREMTNRTASRNPHRSARTLTASMNRTESKEDFQEKLFSGKMLFRDEGEQQNENTTRQDLNAKDANGQDSNGSSWSSSNTVKDNSNHFNLPNSGALTFAEPPGRRGDNSKEKFAARRRSTDISPEDMYRSITMLKGQHQEDNENEGPPLVIGAPRDRLHEKTFQNEAIEHKQQLNLQQNPIEEEAQSDVDKEDNHKIQADPMNTQTSNQVHWSPNSEVAPKSLRRESSGEAEAPNETNNKGHVEDANQAIAENSGPLIKFDISAPPRRRPSHRSTTSFHRASAPSKSIHKKALLKGIKKGKGLHQKFKRRISATSFERSTTNQSNNDENDMDEYLADEDDSEEEENQLHDIPTTRHTLNKAFSFDQSELPKYGSVLRKTGSLDIKNAKDLEELSQSPDFQAMVYKNWKRKHKKQPLLKRRKSWNSKFFDNEHASGFPWNIDSHDGGSDSHADESSMGKLRKYVSQTASHKHNPSEDEIDVHNGESNNPNGALDQNSGEDEQGYYGFDMEPAFTEANIRPGLARTMSTNYLSWQPTIGRNSTFIGLSKMQREELGGVEYTSIKLLCRILLVYYFGFFIMAFIMLVPWISTKKHYQDIVRADGVSPTWWGFFTSMSAFTDLGLTLTPDSMSSFNKAIFPLVTMMWFIVIGNTGFPILLRFIIWIMFILSPELSERRENLGFLLDHPRRCFTLLFPSGATWWLLATLIFLNGTDLILFIILDFGSKVLKPLSHGFRVLSGLFQAISTRTAGFTVVDLSQLHPSVQVSYMLMMYVSVLPLAISIRRTNVYEEQSLGLYGDYKDVGSQDDSGSESGGPNQDNNSSNASGITRDRESGDSASNVGENHPSKKLKRKQMSESFIGAHLRKQLSFDLWFLFLGLFIICICEGGKIQDPLKPNFNVFSVLFEIVSAYGTVGLSLGYPGSNTSFSAQFTTLSKLVIIAMLIRGRHRGLPYALDRAIMLPSQRLDNIDHIEDMKSNRETVQQNGSTTDAVTAYVKKKSSSVGRALRRLRSTVSEPEEHLLHSYAEHHQNQNYNLPGEDEITDHPLEDSSVSQNRGDLPGATSSLESGVNYDDDSYDDEMDDHVELPMTNEAPMALHRTKTT